MDLRLSNFTFKMEYIFLCNEWTEMNSFQRTYIRSAMLLHNWVSLRCFCFSIFIHIIIEKKCHIFCSIQYKLDHFPSSLSVRICTCMCVRLILKHWYLVSKIHFILLKSYILMAAFIETFYVPWIYIQLFHLKNFFPKFIPAALDSLCRVHTKVYSIQRMWRGF